MRLRTPAGSKSIVALLVLMVLPFCDLNAQTYWYYNGSGALNTVTSWGSNTDGTGGNPADFTGANTQYIIQNSVAVNATGTWTVSGASSKVVLGNPTTPSAAITLTLNAGAVITVPSASFDVSAPVTGNHKIIYKNSSAISLGTVNDANLELVFDGATITTSTSRTFGNVSLINNAVVDMGAASAVMKNLTVEAGSVLSGPIGSSAQYIAIKSGGAVVINGTFRAGRTGTVTAPGRGALYTTGVAIPVVTSTSYGTILFQDATEPPNITLGSASTIDYYRGTTSQTGVQGITPMAYANLVLSNLAVSSGKSFAVDGTNTISVSGTFTINLTGSASITSPSPTTTLNLLPNARLVINSATTLNASGRLFLRSDATGTASIGPLATGASLVGNVTVQQFIPSGSRRYRFLSHPFSSAMPLSQLTDNIDITGNPAGTTGQAGQTTGTGFTATTTNNPSAYYFNIATADGGATNDAGWTAYTEANTSGWGVGQGIRVLIRGTKAQSGTLDGTNTTPNAVTLDMTGTINTGAVALNLATGGTGATAGFNLVGNPYPSPVDIGAVLTAASNIGNAIYLRNPQTGSYTTITPIPSSYVIPANTAFVVKALANTTLNFTESNKVVCAGCATVFRAPIKRTGIAFKILKGEMEYDNFYLGLDARATNGFDVAKDADKLMNDDISIYFVGNDGHKLAANYTNQLQGTIALGIAPGLVADKNRTYKLVIADFELPANTSLVLHDKWKNTYTRLNTRTVYEFSVDISDKNSFGDGRFEIMAGK